MSTAEPSKNDSDSTAEGRRAWSTRISEPGERRFRHVEIVADQSRPRRFHQELAERIRKTIGARVSTRQRTDAAPLPRSVDLLLSLEMLLVSRAPHLCARVDDPADVGQLANTPCPAGGERPADDADVVLDLTGSVPDREHVWRLLYDGEPGEQSLVGALLAGRMPLIEIGDTGSGEILGRGDPCADNASNLCDAFDNVLWRSIDLVVLALRGWGSYATRESAAPRRARLRDVVAFEAKMLPFIAARRLYHLCCHAPHWRICWRYIDGPGVWDTGSLAGPEWRVLPDPGGRFYADPFPVLHDGGYWLFFEDFDHRTGKAAIAMVPFGPSGPTQPARVVLEEPWHLSYPSIFRHNDQIWMVPESVERRCVRLYRADPFPDRWVYEATLLDDIEASDATVFQQGGTFWMTATTRSDSGSWSDSLSLFFAADPTGPWEPHPGNPVLIDQAAARPAGNVVRLGNRIMRPVQDCTAGYGTGVGLAEITRLDIEGYEQELRTVLRPRPGWPGNRLHTLNRAGALECIDSTAHSPRCRVLARHLQNWSGRRAETS